MYVFTAHVPGDYEAPLVAVFDEVPTMDGIVTQFANTVPSLQPMTMFVAMEGTDVPKMLDGAEKILAAFAAAGEWPSIGKLSSDGGMYFSMQLIVDRPVNRN